MSEIVEAVARAMCEQDGAKWDAASFNETPNGEEPEEQREYWRDKARAAIEAYEAAKREAEKPYIMHVKNGVTHWSDGLCSPSVPGSKKFAEEQIRALNPFDEERMRPREDKLNWERPE